MEKEIESKDKEIDDLKRELEFLKSQILNKNKKLFGQSSEQIDSIQISLFNDAEKDILKYIPAKPYIVRHVTYSYACKSCQETTGETNITTTKSQATLLHKSMVSNEILAHSMCLKYLYALPLYLHLKS